MMRNRIWTLLVRAALPIFAALILAVTVAPAQAAVPGDPGGFDHFVDCAWLIVTNGAEHHLHCGPNNVELTPGFPGTGVTLSTPSTVPSQTELPAAPSCCPCESGSLDIDFGPLVAAADDTLWTGHSDALEEFLLACCPCSGS